MDDRWSSRYCDAGRSEDWGLLEETGSRRRSRYKLLYVYGSWRCRKCWRGKSMAKAEPGSECCQRSGESRGTVGDGGSSVVHNRSSSGYRDAWDVKHRCGWGVVNK